MRILIIALCLAAPVLLKAADLPEEECDFDQKEQLRYMLELKKKYPGSHYSEKESYLSIGRGKDTVHLGIGGCVHYGVMIELETGDAARYDSEEALMAAILELSREYSQGLLDQKRLQTVIREKQWNNPAPGIYFLNYGADAVTEVYWHKDGDKLVLGIYSYN